MINRVSTVLVTGCLLMVFLMPLQVFGDGAVFGAETTDTYVTLTVLGDIKGTLKLGFSHEYEGPPVTAETVGTAWNFGTILPQEDALGKDGFPGAGICIEGYVWIIDYQSNSCTRCVQEVAEVNGNDISLIQPFLWWRTWRESGFTDYFQSGPEYSAGDTFPPSYGDVRTFPWGFKIHMPEQEDYTGANPWSIRAGNHKIKIVSKWSLCPPGDDSPPEDPVVTGVGHMDLTVANVIDKALGIGIGQSLETKPESCTYQDLEVGEDWVGEVYPWVLDYRSNSDFHMKAEIPPITFQGEPYAFDIREYMEYYGWSDPNLGPTGHNMYPPTGGSYLFKDTIAATLAQVISFPSKMELDLSGGGDADGAHRWRVPAGVYKPTGNICVSFIFTALPLEDIPAHTFTIRPDDFKVCVPQRQAGYRLPEKGRFSPEDGIRPEGIGFYEHTLNCYQNHDRNVELTCRWSHEKAGEGQIHWSFFRERNVEGDARPDGQGWKGVFKYNPEGMASKLGYILTYEPCWTDVPGDKELIITLSHSPTV